MTVLEAAQKLLEFFSKNAHFEIKNDFKKIMLVSDTDAHQAAVLIALESMEKQGLVARKAVDDKEFWILTKPLLFQPQTLEISTLTAMAIANTINAVVPNAQSNPFQISETDLLNLIEIIKKLSST